jgi:transcriptional regulator with XRE-family HTH domain/tetratricopeptide (TPR) repeat protein
MSLDGGGKPSSQHCGMVMARLRRRARLTQEQLAERAGLSVRSIRNLERGRVKSPRWSSLALVARALDVPEDDLAALLAVPAPVTERADPAAGDPLRRSFNQLPPAPGDFTGRQQEITRAESILGNPVTDGQLASALLLNISGRAGVGKSALAVTVGHRLRENYPDGQFFVDLGGSRRRPRPPSEVLADLLLSLGVESAAVPESVAARTSLFRERSADKRLFVLLDDAADEQQVTQLVPSAPSSAVVVTSRRPLAGSPGIRILDIDVLPLPESIDLLTRILGPGRAAGARGDVELIARWCAGLPLALRIAGARIAARPMVPIDIQAAALADEHGRLDALRYGDLEVRATLQLAYGSLAAKHQNAFAALGRLDLLHFGSSTLEALMDVPAAQAQTSIDTLIDARFLDVSHVDQMGEVRYRFHDLLRLFARELPVDPAWWEAALLRVAGRLLALAGIADEAMPATSDVVVVGATPRLSVASGLERRARSRPFEWFAAEEANVAALIDQLAHAGLAEPAWELAGHLRTYAMIRNRWDIWHHTHASALAACITTGDVRGAASMHFGLGKVRHEVHGSASDEPTELQSAAEVFGALGDRTAASLVYCELASWYAWKADIGRAEQYVRQAVDLARQTASPSTLVDALFVLGRQRARQGRWHDARLAFEEALALCRPLHKSRSEAQLLWQLGVLEYGEGDLEAAARRLTSALAMTRAAHERRGQTATLIQLAKVDAAREQYDHALRHLTAALDLCNQIQDRSLRAQSLTVHADVMSATGRHHEARVSLEEAAVLWRSLENPARLSEVTAVIDRLMSLSSADVSPG